MSTLTFVIVSIVALVLRCIPSLKVRLVAQVGYGITSWVVFIGWFFGGPHWVHPFASMGIAMIWFAVVNVLMFSGVIASDGDLVLSQQAADRERLLNKVHAYDEQQSDASEEAAADNTDTEKEDDSMKTKLKHYKHHTDDAVEKAIAAIRETGDTVATYSRGVLADSLSRVGNLALTASDKIRPQKTTVFRRLKAVFTK